MASLSAAPVRLGRHAPHRAGRRVVPQNERRERAVHPRARVRAAVLPLDDRAAGICG